MRIGMILDKTFPPDPRVENEAVSLVENGFEVYLFCLKYGSQQAASEEINGIKVKRYPSNNLDYKLSALAYTFPFYSRIMSKKIRSFLLSNKIDIIHIHDIRIAGAVFRSNKGLNLPVILDLHDNMPEIMKEYPHVQKFPGKFLISPGKWKKKEEGFIDRATKVVTVSDEFRQEVIQRTNIQPDKIIVVPNTVRRSFYEDHQIDKSIINKYKNDFVILYLGDTGIRRGLLTAIEAIPNLKKKIDNIKLVIVGSNTTDPILKQKVEDLSIQNYVDFQGWQDVKLFPSYIMGSTICISPLYRNVQHDVAYANKLFQYMSFSKPVLVSNATAQKNLVERTKSGLVHNESDSKDFEDKILELYQNKDLREKMGANGKKFIENEFCWEKASTKLIELYQGFNN
ncbi:MAG: glycosyltransferase family 4 protein [Aureibaculum sp.]